jgi:hypothetical protein
LVEVPVQTVSLPLMATGLEGTNSTDTARMEAGEDPQGFEAVTLTFPPAAPAVAVMEGMAETPFHPAGNVHL